MDLDRGPAVSRHVACTPPANRTGGNMSNRSDAEEADYGSQARTGRIAGWVKAWWQFLRSSAQGEIANWQNTLLHRRKFTTPAEVIKMRQPVPRTSRATWYP